MFARTFAFIFILQTLQGCANESKREKEVSDSLHVDSLGKKNDQAQELQEDKRLQSIKELTKSTMSKLLIPLRTNIAKDDPIKMRAYGNLQHLTAIFLVKKLNVVGTPSSPDRYYKQPEIAISLSLDSIVRGEKDTSNMIKVFCKTAFCHEMCHYFSATSIANPFGTTLPNNAEERKAYLSDPAEKEAWGLQGYLFLQELNPVLLNKIIGSKNSMERKKELLINGLYSLYKPWRKPVF